MDLPLILAGPILRRVELNRVVVWLALREPAAVRLAVWPGLHDASPTEPGGIAGTAAEAKREVEVTTLRFGSRLHVVLADLKLGDLGADDGSGDDTSPSLQPVLAPGTEYSYNLRIEHDGTTTDLFLEGLLDERPPAVGENPQQPAGLPIGFARNRLPSFVTCPSEITDLVLLQASCRKGAPDAPNAGQDPNLGADDLMTAFDPLIAAHLGQPLERPHQLFLTGDQIYADETAGPLLPHLTELGRDLIGTDELLQLDTAATFPLTTANFPAGSRQKLCIESARFTSSAASNHVIGLGEYCASYLVAWSEVCWSDLTDELPPVDSSAARDKITDWQGCIDAFRHTEQTAADSSARAKAKKARCEAERSFESAKEGFRAQRQRIEGYRRNVPVVRRILANVATYMIFDDHEITDDWNITQQWRNRVLTSNLGTTIIRNGLLAYAVFQGWGNDPAAWEAKTDASPPGANHELLVSAAKLYAGPSIDAAARDKIDELLGHAAGPVKVTWDYRIDFDSHRVVVLDTRTHRQLVLGHRPPGLLDPDALGKQLPAGPLPPALDLLVVVSPAPVLGPAVSDHVIQPLGVLAIDAKSALEFGGEIDPCDGRALDPFEGQTTADLEAWFADDDAVEALLQRLATYGQAPIVVLSGDVHYGLTAVLDYWKKAGNEFAKTRIVQFTSSACRNVWPDVLQALLAVTRQFVPAQRVLLDLGTPTERLAWLDADPVPVDGAGNAVRPLRGRLRRSPVLVPAGGWPDQAAEQRPPDWAWRLQLVADERSDDPLSSGAPARPDQVRPPAPPPFDPADPVGSYAPAIARHGLAAAENVQLRTIVAEFNVGALRFRRDDDDRLVARGELYSRNHKHTPDPLPAPNTVHEVLLAPTGDDRPEIRA